MNTNYSKIALLLALGVAAGEVGANIFDEFVPRNVTDTGEIASKSGIACKKIKDDDRSDDAKSAKKNAGRVMKEMKRNGMLKTAANADAPDMAQLRAMMTPMIQSDGAAETLLKGMKNFRENIIKDIRKIFSPAVNTTSTTDAININLSTKAEIEKFIAKFSADIKFSDLFKPNKGIAGDLTQTQLENIKYQTHVTDSISKSVVNLFTDMNTALSSAPSTVRIGNDTVDVAPLAEKIRLGVTAAIGNISEWLSNLALIDKSQADILRRKADQIKAVDLIMGLNFVDFQGRMIVLNRIKDMGLDAWFDAINNAKNAFVNNPNLAIPGATAQNKQEAMHTALNAIFSGMDNNQGRRPTTLKFVGVNNNVNDLANPNRVVGSELAFAGLVDVDIVIGADNNLKLNVPSTAGTQEKAEQLFDNVMGPEIMKQINKVRNHTARDRDAAYRAMTDVTGTSDVPVLTKPYGKMTAYELTSLLDKNLEIAKKTAGKPDALNHKLKIEKNIADIVNSLPGYAEECAKKLLSDDMTSQDEGIFKGKNKAGIQKVMDNVADKIKNIRKEMGETAPTVPAAVAKKAAEAKTFADLEASDEFKAKNLKVTDISEDLKKVFAAEKDAVKANEMYVKIHTSLPVDQATKAPVEADVKALKALFAAEVQEALKLPAQNLETALNLPAKPADAEAEDAEPKKGKKNKRARARGRGRGRAASKGRKGRGRGSRSASKEKEGNARSESKGRRASKGRSASKGRIESKGRSASKGKVRGRAVARADAKEATAEA